MLIISKNKTIYKNGDYISNVSIEDDNGLIRGPWVMVVGPIVMFMLEVVQKKVNDNTFLQNFHL